MALGKQALISSFVDTHMHFASFATFHAGSDAPCSDPDLLLWIHNVCNHPIEGESISVYETLRTCTYNGYYATFDEKEHGSLEAGKIADMVILSDNPYEERAEMNNLVLDLRTGGSTGAGILSGRGRILFLIRC